MTSWWGTVRREAMGVHQAPHLDGVGGGVRGPSQYSSGGELELVGNPPSGGAPSSVRLEETRAPKILR